MDFSVHESKIFCVFYQKKLFFYLGKRSFLKKTYISGGTSNIEKWNFLAPSLKAFTFFLKKVFLNLRKDTQSPKNPNFLYFSINAMNKFFKNTLD